MVPRHAFLRFGFLVLLCARFFSFFLVSHNAPISAAIQIFTLFCQRLDSVREMQSETVREIKRDLIKRVNKRERVFEFLGEKYWRRCFSYRQENGSAIAANCAKQSMYKRNARKINVGKNKREWKKEVEIAI